MDSYVKYLKENDINTNMIADQKVIENESGKKYYVFSFKDSIIVLDENKEFYEVIDRHDENVFSINNGINTYALEEVSGLKCASMLNRFVNTTQSIYAYDDIKNAYFCQTDLNKFVSVMQVYHTDNYNFNDYIAYLDKRKPIRIEYYPNIKTNKKRRVFEAVDGKINQYLEYKYKIIPVGNVHPYEYYESSFKQLGFTSFIDKRVLDFYLGKGELSEVKNVVKVYKNIKK